jgi:FkbM family methyltransferase
VSVRLRFHPNIRAHVPPRSTGLPGQLGVSGNAFAADHLKMNATARELLRVGRCGLVARTLAPRAARVSPLLGFGVLGKPRGRRVDVTVKREGLLWNLDLRDDAQRIMYLGLYERELRESVLSQLRSGDVFVDVGANVGFWSLPAAARGATVISFEPNPYAAGLLRWNASLNTGVGVELREKAVGSGAGELNLYAFDLEAGSSMTTANRAALPTLAAEWGAGSDEIEAITVPVVTLDDELESVDVLKIDVEGHEEHALQGARRVLTELRPRLVVIELIGTTFGHEGNCPERTAALLNDYGYDAPLPRPLPDTFHGTVLFTPVA